MRTLGAGEDKSERHESSSKDFRLKNIGIRTQMLKGTFNGVPVQFTFAGTNDHYDVKEAIRIVSVVRENALAEKSVFRAIILEISPEKLERARTLPNVDEPVIDESDAGRSKWAMENIKMAHVARAEKLPIVAIDLGHTAQAYLSRQLYAGTKGSGDDRRLEEVAPGLLLFAGGLVLDLLTSSMIPSGVAGAYTSAKLINSIITGKKPFPLLGRVLRVGRFINAERTRLDALVVGTRDRVMALNAFTYMREKTRDLASNKSSAARGFSAAIAAGDGHAGMMPILSKLCNGKVSPEVVAAEVGRNIAQTLEILSLGMVEEMKNHILATRIVSRHADPLAEAMDRFDKVAPAVMEKIASAYVSSIGRVAEIDSEGVTHDYNVALRSGRLSTVQNGVYQAMLACIPETIQKIRARILAANP